MSPFWHPIYRQVGPGKESPPEAWEIWHRALEAARQLYPIGDSILTAEARRANLSQEQTQQLIAHEEYITERRKLTEKWRGEYMEVTEPQELEETEEREDE